MYTRTVSNPAKHNTDLDSTETFEKMFFPGVRKLPFQAQLTFSDVRQFEVTVCSEPWGGKTQTTYGQLCPS
jgi:hypothetical protein